MNEELTLLQQKLEDIKKQERELIERRVLEDVVVLDKRFRAKLSLERRIASIKQIEFAEELPIRLELGFNWYLMSGFSMDPMLVCDLFNQVERSVTFCFEGCVDSRFGGLNDEVYEEHSLYGKGLGLTGFFVVRNSRWLSEIEKAMSVHPSYDPSLWREYKHYLFRDKGGEFSCLAKSDSYQVNDYPVSKVADFIRSLKVRLNRPTN